MCVVSLVISGYLESLWEEAVGVYRWFSVSLTVSKWKASEQMVNSIDRVTGIPSCPFPHPSVTSFLDGGQQTANKPLNSAENMLDLIPARDSLSKLEWKLFALGWCLLRTLVMSKIGQRDILGSWLLQERQTLFHPQGINQAEMKILVHSHILCSCYLRSFNLQIANDFVKK